MQIKLRHLEVFNALIEAGSVSRAAERLNLTQPAVSIALSNLEADLGFRLFHRDRGYFAPTGEAMLLHAEVAQSLLALARIEQRAHEIRTGAAGGVSIATNGVLAINFLPELIAHYHADNPGTRVEMRVHSSRQISTWVSGRQIDIGLIDTPVPVAGVNSEAFLLECVCIMRADDPLAAETVICPELLKGRSVIAILGDHMVDRQLDRLLSEAGVTIERNTTGSYFAIARKLVAAGNGVALIDPINALAPLGDGVVWRRFVPRVDTEIAMLTAKDLPLSAATRMIVSRIREGLNRGARLPES
ncbi:LysR family transcriptional regulator [Seohaeicola zhoushanensis]